MTDVRHLTMAELEAGLDEIRQSPKAEGVLAMIVRRPQTEEREILQEGALDLAEGLLGDNWRNRGSSRMADGSAHPDMQLNIMNTRVIHLVAQDKARWSLAGDQLFIDLDLSAENLPHFFACTRLKKLFFGTTQKADKKVHNVLITHC